MAFHVTQCPSCESTFNTSARMLESAAGRVRCGACLTVFEAEQNFVAEEVLDDNESGSVFIGNNPEDYFDPGRFLTRSALTEAEPAAIAADSLQFDHGFNLEPDSAATDSTAIKFHAAVDASLSTYSAGSANSAELAELADLKREADSLPAMPTAAVANGAQHANPDAPAADPFNSYAINSDPSQWQNYKAPDTSRQPGTTGQTDAAPASSALAAPSTAIEACAVASNPADWQNYKTLASDEQPGSTTGAQAFARSQTDTDISRDQPPVVGLKPATDAQSTTTIRELPEPGPGDNTASPQQSVVTNSYQPRQRTDPAEISLSYSFTIDHSKTLHTGPNTTAEPGRNIPGSDSGAPAVAATPGNDLPRSTAIDSADTNSEPAAGTQATTNSNTEAYLDAQVQQFNQVFSEEEFQASVADNLDQFETEPDLPLPEDQQAEIASTAEARDQATETGPAVEANDLAGSAAAHYIGETELDLDEGAAITPQEAPLLGDDSIEEPAEFAATFPVTSATTSPKTNSETVSATEANATAPQDADTAPTETEPEPEQPAAVEASPDANDAATDQAEIAEAVDDSVEAIRARALTTPLRDEEALEAIPQENLTALGKFSSPVELFSGTQRRLGQQLLLSVLVLLLAATLTSQYLWRHFATLNQLASIRPIYAVACDWLSCELPVYSDIDSIRSDNLAVSSHPDAANGLMVNVAFRNTAAFPQPFPILILGFNSAANTIVALREFAPQEYLEPGLRNISLMPVMTPVQVNLEIVDPGPGAVNYTLAFRRP